MSRTQKKGAGKPAPKGGFETEKNPVPVTVAGEMKEMVNAIPMVGWHDPFGTFDHEGKEWGVAIMGGCKAIVVTTPKEMGSRKFTFDLGQVLAAMLPEIDKEIAAKKDVLQGWEKEMEDERP